MTSVCCSLALHLHKEPDSFSLVVSQVLCAALGSPKLNKPNSQVKCSCSSPLLLCLFLNTSKGFLSCVIEDITESSIEAQPDGYWLGRDNPFALCDPVDRVLYFFGIAAVVYLRPYRTPRVFLTGLLPSRAGSCVCPGWILWSSCPDAIPPVWWVPLSMLPTRASIYWCLRAHSASSYSSAPRISGRKDEAESAAHTAVERLEPGLEPYFLRYFK